MRKKTGIFLLLVILFSACAAPTQPTLAPTRKLTLSVAAPTATLTPEPSPTPSPLPLGVYKIGELGGEALYSAVWSPDAKTYAVAGSLGIHIFDSTSRKEIKNIPGFTGRAEYSPDSQFIAVGDYNEKGTRLIRMRDGVILGEFESYFDSLPHAFSPYTFSPDSQQFAYIFPCSVGSEPNCKDVIHIWNIAARQDVLQITASKVDKYFSFLKKLSFDPTGTLLLATASDGLIYAWDTFTSKFMFNLQSPSGYAVDLVFSHNGKYLASYDVTYGDQENRFIILLWDWQTKQRQTFSFERNSFLLSMSFTADDSQINLSFDDDSTWVCDLHSGKISQAEKFADRESLFLREMRERGEYIARPDSMAYSPDGQTLAVGSDSVSPITLWDVSTHKVQATLDSTATQLEYTHHANHLVVLQTHLEDSTSDSDISVWDAQHGVKLLGFKAPHTGFFSISPDDSTLVLNLYQQIQLRDIETGVLLRTLSTKQNAWELAYSADGRTLSAVTAKYLGQLEYEIALQSWDAATGSELPVAFHPVKLGNSDRVLGLSHDKLALFQYQPNAETDIVFWNVRTGEKVQTIKNIDLYHPAMFFTANERVVVVVDGGAGAGFYDIATGRPIYKTTDFHSLTFSPDGKQFAMPDQSITLWDFSQIIAALP